MKSKLETLIENEVKTARELELENVESEIALKWVEEQNQITKLELASSPTFKEMEESTLAIYEDKNKIPNTRIRKDGYFYNFWQDENHVQGIWRRATAEEYRKSAPAWEILFDLDHLPDEDIWKKLTSDADHQPGEKWVWKSVDVNDQCTKALIGLSLGGKDATVYREFDLTTKTFVKDGFYLKEAKNNLSWFDDNSVFVTSDFGEGSLTESGYPRIVKLWYRREPLEAAKIIYEGERTDVSVGASITRRPEGTYAYVARSISFYETEYFLLDPTTLSLTSIPLPIDAELEDQFNGKMIIKLRTEWHVPNGPVYKAGSVITVDFASIHDPMHLNTSLVFEPTSTCSVNSICSIKNYILIALLNNVCGELHQYQLVDDHWIFTKVPLPKKGKVEIMSASDYSNDYLISYSNFLTPETLYYYHSDIQSLEILKQAPKNFNSDNMCIKQFQAISKDGTAIPYFVVHPKKMLFDGSNPTLLNGYGGFEISEEPDYLGATGKLWLEKGGVYILANIRGGGEFGPEWHQAALKENRHKCFEDFIAVAEDLIAKKITSPKHLGIMGGSNGGLLVGATFTQRPELFNAVVCSVPLLDMLNYHKWLAGASWMAEYGDPEDPEMRKILESYSPYHRVSPDKTYPKVLFTTSTRDDRVHPAHARKMVDKMQAMGHPVYYFENTEGGHSDASNLKMFAFNAALEFNYLKKQLMENKLDLLSSLFAEHSLATKVTELMMIDKIRHEGHAGKGFGFFQQLPPRVLKEVHDISVEAQEAYDQRFGLVPYRGA